MRWRPPDPTKFLFHSFHAQNWLYVGSTFVSLERHVEWVGWECDGKLGCGGWSPSAEFGSRQTVDYPRRDITKSRWLKIELECPCCNNIQRWLLRGAFSICATYICFAIARVGCAIVMARLMTRVSHRWHAKKFFMEAIGRLLVLINQEVLCAKAGFTYWRETLLNTGRRSPIENI